MYIASIALLLTLSSIFGYSEGFVVRRLVALPALPTNIILATTAPQHARVTTALGLWDASKGTNKQGTREAPQHARFPVLRYHKDLFDVVSIAIPTVLAAIYFTFESNAKSKALDAKLDKLDKAIAAEKDEQDKAIAAKMDKLDKAIAAEKDEQDKAIAAEKERQDKAIAAERENFAVRKAIQVREEAFAAERESWKVAIAAERERQDKAFAAERESWKVAIAAERESRDKALAAEKERQDKAIVAERERQDKAIVAERERQDKALAAEKERQKEDIPAARNDFMDALDRQNEIWSLRFEKYAAKGEKVEDKDELPPP